MLFNEKKSMLVLFCKNNSRIYEYELSVDQSASLGEFYGFLISHFKKEGNPCIIRGNRLFLKRPLISKKTLMPTSKFTNPIMIKILFRSEIPLKSAKKFFAALFSKIVDHVNDSGDSQELASLNESKIFQLQMFQGLWSAELLGIGRHDDGVTIKLDINHKLVCHRSAYDFFQQELNENSHRPDCLEVIKASLIGKSIMTRYDNKVYAIHDVDFATKPYDRFQDDKENTSFADYYKKKYNIDTRFEKQPMLISKVAFEEPSTGNVKNFMHCLIPEFCYPVYTEWNMMKDSMFCDFMGILGATPKVREVLGEWNISLKKISDIIKRISLIDSNDANACRSSYLSFK